MNSVVIGMKSFFEGLEIFRSNKVIRNLSFIPIFMSVVLLTMSLIIGVLYIDEAITFVAGQVIADLNVYLKSLLYFFSILVYLFLMYFFVFIIVSVLAIPIAQKLAEKVFEIKKHPTKKIESFSSFIKSFLKMLKASLIKIVILLFLSVFIFIAGFIPMAYPVAVLLTFMLVTWDCIDYAFEIDNLAFKERWNFFTENAMAFLSFSCCVGVLLFIPLVQLIVLPIAVIGANCLYINLKNKRGSL